MHTFIRVVLPAALAAVLFPLASFAAVYRCILEDGQTSYQQFPCSGDSRPLVIRDRPSGWSALRPGERALLKHYRARDAARRRRTPRVKEPGTKESKDCWKKRRQLNAVQAKLRHGYRLSEAGELRRKRDDYSDYLREFCP